MISRSVVSGSDQRFGLGVAELFDFGDDACFDERGEFGDSWRFKNGAHGELDLKGIGDAGEEANGQEGMPAEAKVMVVNADGRKVEEVAPDFAEQFFNVVARAGGGFLPGGEVCG